MRKVVIIFCFSFFSCVMSAWGISTHDSIAYKKSNEATHEILATEKIPLLQIETDTIPDSIGTKKRRINVSEKSFRPLSDARIFFGSIGKVAISHGVSLSFLLLAHQSQTNWEHEFGPELFKDLGRNFNRAWTQAPVWDHDAIPTNYIWHPYAGSFYYNLVRSKGASGLKSFGYTVFGSTVFEYVTEAMFEQPSIQDLIVTPLVGSLMGEGIHRLTLQMSANGFNWREKIFVFALNPGYFLNHGWKVPTASRRMQLQKFIIK